MELWLVISYLVEVGLLELFGILFASFVTIGQLGANIILYYVSTNIECELTIF